MMPFDRRQERAWLRAAQRGSHEAFEQLFRAHWPAAYRAAYLVLFDHQSAEDVAQEGWLAAVRSLDRFDRRRPFAPWLHRIVVNRAIDHSRARRHRAEITTDEPDRLPADTGQREGGGASSELAEAMAALGSEQRAVIVLRYLLDYTPGEIAELLEVSRGTVNSRHRCGLDALAELVPTEEAP